MAATNIFGLIPDAFKIIAGAGLWDAFRDLALKWIRDRVDPTRRKDFFKAYITNMIGGNLSDLYDKACRDELTLPDGTVILEDAFIDLFAGFSAEDLMLASVTMDMMPPEKALRALMVIYNNPLQQRIVHMQRLAKKWLVKPEKTIVKASLKAWLKAIALADNRKKIADGWDTALIKSAKKEKKQLKQQDDDDRKIARLKKRLQNERKKRW